MGKIIITDNGKFRDVSKIELAEEVIKLRKKGDPWKVIEKLLEVWSKIVPDEVEAVSINLTEYREAAVDKKFGQTKMGQDQERRFKLAFPVTLQLMIRTQYKADELPFDEKFYSEFAKRYPAFRVAEQD